MSEDKMYLFRRRGMSDWCSCNLDRYEELEAKPKLFEVKIVYDRPSFVEVKGVVVRDNVPTLVTKREVTPSDIKLYMLEYDFLRAIFGDQQ